MVLQRQGGELHAGARASGQEHVGSVADPTAAIPPIQRAEELEIIIIDEVEDESIHAGARIARCPWGQQGLGTFLPPGVGHGLEGVPHRLSQFQQRFQEILRDFKRF